MKNWQKELFSKINGKDICEIGSCESKKIENSIYCNWHTEKFNYDNKNKNYWDLKDE